jgi:hypothetical protein
MEAFTLHAEPNLTERDPACFLAVRLSLLASRRPILLRNRSYFLGFKCVCTQKRLFRVNKRLLHQILSINENTRTWFDILEVQKCQLQCFQFGSARLAMGMVTLSARFSSARPVVWMRPKGLKLLKEIRSEILHRTCHTCVQSNHCMSRVAAYRKWRYIYRSSTVLCVFRISYLRCLILRVCMCLCMCVHTQSRTLLSTHVTALFPVDTASLKIRSWRYMSFILKQCGIPLLMPSCRSSSYLLIYVCTWVAFRKSYRLGVNDVLQ